MNNNGIYGGDRREQRLRQLAETGAWCGLPASVAHGLPMQLRVLLAPDSQPL